MFDQKVFFKLMLWSLAVAAVMGVMAVLTASFDVVGRVMATALLTSVAAAFLWQAATRLEQTPVAVNMAQVGALLFYLFALCGIWQIGNEGKMWGTSIICLGCLTVSASGWAMRRQSNYRYTGLMTAAASIASGLLWLIGIWSNSFDSKIAMTGFAIAGWSAGVAVCLMGLGTNSVRHWRWIGVGAATCGLLVSEYAIIQHIAPNWIDKWLFVMGSTTAVVIHALLCYGSRLAPKMLAIRPVAVISTIITALLADIILLLDLSGDHFILRITIAAAIVASTSTIATAFIIQRHRKHSRPELITQSEGAEDAYENFGEFQTLRVECPQCTQLNPVRVGSASCPQCGLRFKIEVFR